jgi:hypothetical protein
VPQGLYGAVNSKNRACQGVYPAGPFRELIMIFLKDIFDSFIELGSGIKEATTELTEGLLEICMEDLPGDISEIGEDIVDLACKGGEELINLVDGAVDIACNHVDMVAELHPGLNLLTSFVDNVCREQVTPVNGSVLYCDLLCASHSGIYIGSNQIVHLNGDGEIECVSPREFIARLDGINTAISIYVSCAGMTPVGSQSAADFAKRSVGTQSDYNLLTNNCHQFVANCLTNGIEKRVLHLGDLKNLTGTVLEANTWRVWDLTAEELLG